MGQYTNLSDAQGAALASIEGNGMGTGVLPGLLDKALSGGGEAGALALATTNAATIAAATSADTPSTIVKRDASGHASLVVELPKVAVADKPTGGAIGTAAATVDVATVALVTQTTAAQTLTLPSPTNAVPIRTFTVVNTGSASFTCLGATVAANGVVKGLWTGTAWIAA